MSVIAGEFPGTDSRIEVAVRKSSLIEYLISR